MAPTPAAAVVAGVVGYLSIRFLLRWLTGHNTGVFAAYRVVVGGLRVRNRPQPRAGV